MCVCVRVCACVCVRVCVASGNLCMYLCHIEIIGRD